LIDNTTYYYKVSSYVNDSIYNISNIFNFTTLENDPIFVNISISNIQVTSVSNTSVIITWNTNLNSTTRIDYGLISNNLSNSKFISESIKEHSVTLIDLSPGILYYYQLNSTDPFNNSIYGASVITNFKIVTIIPTPEEDENNIKYIIFAAFALILVSIIVTISFTIISMIDGAGADLLISVVISSIGLTIVIIIGYFIISYLSKII
jgi:hypothetical protein